MTRFLGRINWVAILIPLLVGLPFLIIGLSEVYKAGQTVSGYAVAQGTVVDNVYRPFAEGGAAYTPVVEFPVSDGRLIPFTDGIGTIPPEYEVGMHVKVLYDPNNVQEARVYSWKRIWFAPVFISFIGLLPILIGGGLVWLLSRKGTASLGEQIA